MPQENQTDWIEWQGGECPVDPDTRIEVRFRPFTEGKPQDWDFCTDKASEISRNGVDGWVHKNSAGDIIAYRVTSL